jgi:hypothetical protein
MGAPMFARATAVSFPCGLCRAQGRITRKQQIRPLAPMGRIVDACPHCDNPPPRRSQ